MIHVFIHVYAAQQLAKRVQPSAGEFGEGGEKSNDTALDTSKDTALGTPTYSEDGMLLITF